MTWHLMIPFKKDILLVIIILLGGHLIFAQPTVPVFRHLTTNDGLSHNTVQSLCQDKEGFMWIGTMNGLDRYDGIRFKEFRYYPRRYSTSVNNILEDSLGNIWFEGPLVKYNKASDSYREMIYDRINDFTFGPDNKVYVVISNTILCKNIYNQDTIFTNLPGVVHNPEYRRINCIKFSPDRNLWIGTDRGFYIYNPLEEKISPFNSMDYPNQRFINDFLFDSAGNLWVIFTNEVIKYNFKSGHTQRFRLPLPGNPVLTCIYQTKNDRIWIGTFEQGLFYLDVENMQFKCLIEQENISDLFEDQSNRLWVATQNSGVFIYDSLSNYFNQLPLSLASKSISMYHCDILLNHENKGLWIGARSYGLLYYDLESLKTTLIDSINNMIDILYEDKSGMVWYNHLNFLVCFDPAQKRIKRIKHPVPDQFPIINEGNTLTKLIPFNDRFIISTDFGQVFAFNPQNDKFNLIYDKRNIIRTMLAEDDKLFLCVYNVGVLVLDKSLQAIDTIFHNDLYKGLISHAVMAIHKDKFDTLWIGGYGGLSKYSPQLHMFENKFDFNNNANYITSILEDVSGNLWLGSSKGIYKYDRESQQFILFDSSHGMPTGRFFANSAVKMQDGKMYFGGNNGIVFFDPEKVRINTAPPPIVLTDFIITPSGKKSKKKDASLYKNVNYLKSIHLKYNENSFTVKYAALDYTSPTHNKYKFKLDGLENNWNLVDNQSEATYTNLNGGKYIFYVNGTNNDGVWNPKPRALIITVDRPIQKTWWAISLYVLTGIGIILTFFNFNLRKIRLQHQLDIKDKETKSLIEIDSAKSQFFTNISHEFRTPLSLIFDPVKRMIRDDIPKKEQLKLLDLIRSNAQKLLFLINQILDLSKLKTGKLILEVEEVDFLDFIRPVFSAFKSRAEALKLDYEMIVQGSDFTVWIDKKKMECTLINIISNAFKFCPEGKITIALIDEADKVMINIEDTGIGIPNNQKDRIFDQYYQVNSLYHQNISGTGIGLALVREYMNLHHASIYVQSEENKGTKFTIGLLKGKSHFQPTEISSHKSNYISEIIIGERESAVSDEADTYDTDTFKYKYTILLIEDNIDMTAYLKDALSDKFKMIFAENGSDGFERTLKFHPDVVISDVMMPVMDGFAYCEKVKRDERVSHIPIILLTARVEHEDRIKGLCLGADDYLEKPFDIDELELRIKYHIDRYNQIQAQFLKDFKFKSEEEFKLCLNDQFLKKAFSFIEVNYKDEQFGVEKLSELMCMSRNHLYRKSKKMTNKTPNELIRNFRLRKARYLLQNNSASVSEICFEAGFNNLSYFSKCFYEFYGKHPSEFK